MSGRNTSIVLQALVVLAVLFWFVPDSLAIPAFARKYSLNCTACHEAWPALNDFGRAFRDAGYQLQEGKDDPTTTSPGYWPISIRLTPHYEFDSVSSQTTDQGTKTLRSGALSDIGLDLLTAGTLDRNVSFLVVPTGFTQQDGVELESAWVRFDNLFGSSWANFKIGKHEVDLPRSAHRPWSLTGPGYLIYSYHAPGSVSLYDMGQNQRGIEYVGHDANSLNRVAVSVFSVEQSPGSGHAVDTPGAYVHASHQWVFDHGPVSATRVGVFGSYTTWPTSFLTSGATPIAGSGSDLRNATKLGVEAQAWFGPAATPLRAILVVANGRDARGLIPGATRDGTFRGGFLELAYTPTLTSTFFGRLDLVSNLQQGVVEMPREFGDQRGSTVGIRHTLHYSTHTEYAIHLEYSTQKITNGAADGSDLITKHLLIGVDLAF